MADDVRLFILDVQQGGPEKPEVLIWAKTQKGEPVLVSDSSFRPYFYVEHRKGMKPAEVEDLAKRLADLRVDGARPERVEAVSKKLFGAEKGLLRITLPRPHEIGRAHV